MSDQHRSAREVASLARPESHLPIEPSILYVGTPVALLATENADASFNLAPMSSVWALGRTLVLGMSLASQTAHNLRHRADVVVNFPSHPQWQAVERLATLTGRDPVPDHKRDRFTYEPNKFAAAGLNSQPSTHVRPPRVRECPLQLEARAVTSTPDASAHFLIIQAEVVAVHAHPSIVIPDSNHVDPHAWSPLIYNFRHYHGLSPEVGYSFRSETVRKQ